MTLNERSIATAISRQVLQRKCLLLVDNCQWTGHECDVLAVTRDLRIIDVEIKISRADLKADYGKDKWWHRGVGSFQNGIFVQPAPTAVAWPRKVWKHYYAMPEDIWNDDLLATLASSMSGVILVREAKPPQPVVLASVVRRAKPNKNATRLSAEHVLDIARLANLRMWSAYEQIAQMTVSATL